MRRRVRQILVLISGGTVLLAGTVMIMLPGPGVLVIALGLGILATEFAWARDMLERMRQIVAKGARMLGLRRGCAPADSGGAQRSCSAAPEPQRLSSRPISHTTT
jgi:hypothetical protein